ncbi:MAG: hypothetical protein DYH02_04910 [Candidatus Omnitrophica bacterium COP1]|nr:hypothetical protein [Candidatus Omnitrophica bacterium COP1]
MNGTDGGYQMVFFVRLIIRSGSRGEAENKVYVNMDEKLKADRCQPGSIRSLPGMRSAVRWLAPTLSRISE